MPRNPRVAFPHANSLLHAFQDKQHRRLGLEFLRPLAVYDCGEAEFERITLALIDASPVETDSLVASPPDTPGIEGLRILRRIRGDETVYVSEHSALLHLLTRDRQARDRSRGI